ncbi:cytochrome c [Alphaproteobacteria bacterium]|nr:cytochrome c [Alphaproteobacteria bacterium]MDC1120625.1 cytochrome c [Alphaproteobacteria bacterium]
MPIQKKPLMCLSAIAIGLSAAAMAHSGATGIIKERMDFFKRSKDNLKAINMHLRGGDFRAIVPLAEDIRDWAGKMPNYFPQGSDGKPSEAAPAIWTDFDGFTKAAKDHYEAADTLISAAKSENAGDIAKAFKATAATCKSCHKSYRLK